MIPNKLKNDSIKGTKNTIFNIKYKSLICLLLDIFFPHYPNSLIKISKNHTVNKAAGINCILKYGFNLLITKPSTKIPKDTILNKIPGTVRFGYVLRLRGNTILNASTA